MSATPTPTQTTQPSYTPYNPYAQPTGSGVFGGNSPPSIYLICFIVIILALLSISSLLALRTIKQRRHLHAAWARTGYADAFFDTPYYRDNIPRGALSAAQRWGAYRLEAFGPNPGGAGGVGSRGRGEGKFGKKPMVWEFEGKFDEDDEEEVDEKRDHRREDTDTTMIGTWRSEKGKGRAPSRYDALPRGWQGIMPISTSILLPPPPPTPETPSSPANKPLTHPAPTFWQTVRTIPMRPPPPPPPPTPDIIPAAHVLDSITWSSPPPSTSSPYPDGGFGGGGGRGQAKELEVSVLIALPMEEGWEARLDRDDGERELPDVALGVARVRLG